MTANEYDFGPGVSLNNPAFIHDTARLYGNIHIDEGASIWPYVVMRAEMHEIRIGKHSNLQDFVMVHIGYGSPTIVGDYCSITHHCTIHGCTIGNNCLLGLNVTVMDDCVIGDNCIIAGHSFLKEGTVIPENSIVMGTPAKVVATRNCFKDNYQNSLLYHRNALAYAAGNHRVWEDPAVLSETASQAEAAFQERFGSNGFE